jgi:hypothetical protein
MNWRATLILIVIAGALYAFFDLYEIKQPGTREATQNASHLFTADRGQIDGLTVTNHDLKIDLRQANGHWTMKSPLADNADQALIDEAVTDLEGLRKDDTIPASDIEGKQSKLQEFGLQSPKVQLSINVQGAAKPTQLAFGNDSAIEGKTYVQVGGSGGSVYVVGDALKKVLEKDVNAWRDHRLTEIAATDVTRMTIKDAAGEIELQRNGDHWKIAKPLDARANDQKVNDLVSQITNLQIQSFVADDKANAATYGLADPRGTITVFTPTDTKGTELMIGASPTTPAEPPKASGAGSPTPAPKQADTVYARLPARQSIYTVGKAVLDVLKTTPNDLRDHSLVRLNADMVDRIKITPGTGAPFTFGRKDKTWSLLNPASGQAVDAAKPTELMQQLNAAQVASFVADSAADLAKYGLDHPSMQVTFSSFASENTAETNAGEKTIATVSFGKADGANVYARVEEEPFVVAVPQTVLDGIPTDPLMWQPLSIFQLEPEKIGVLEETMKGRPEIALTRPEKGDWTLTKGTGPVDQAKVQSTINTLSHLHAVRWVGAVKPEYALDPTATTLSFAATGDPKTRRTLVLGALTPDQMAYARVDGKDGAFLVSRPDYDTILAPLVPLPAATPAPATPAPATPAPATPAPATPAPATPAPATPAPATPAPATPAPATPAPATPAPATPAHNADVRKSGDGAPTPDPAISRAATTPQGSTAPSAAQTPTAVTPTAAATPAP